MWPERLWGRAQDDVWGFWEHLSTTMIVHYDGLDWSLIDEDSYSGKIDVVMDVWGTTGGLLYFVGHKTDWDSEYPRVVSYDGNIWFPLVDGEEFEDDQGEASCGLDAIWGDETGKMLVLGGCNYFFNGYQWLRFQTGGGADIWGASLKNAYAVRGGGLGRIWHYSCP
jgi:hypothetical protein